MELLLYIDTSDFHQTQISVEIDGKKINKVIDSNLGKAQITLPIIEEIFKDNNLNIKDITEIRVNTGPGSFTGLRVGIAIAQMLGKLLNIPVNGKSPGTTITPEYSTSKYDSR